MGIYSASVIKEGTCKERRDGKNESSTHLQGVRFCRSKEIPLGVRRTASISQATYPCSVVRLTVINIPNLDWIQVVEPIPVSSEEQVASFLADVMARGGEGLIFRNPSAKYHDSKSFLKLVVRVLEFCKLTRLATTGSCCYGNQLQYLC